MSKQRTTWIDPNLVGGAPGGVVSMPRAAMPDGRSEIDGGDFGTFVALESPTRRAYTFEDRLWDYAAETAQRKFREIFGEQHWRAPRAPLNDMEASVVDHLATEAVLLHCGHDGIVEDRSGKRARSILQSKATLSPVAMRAVASSIATSSAKRVCLNSTTSGSYSLLAALRNSSAWIVRETLLAALRGSGDLQSFATEVIRSARFPSPGSPDSDDDDMAGDLITLDDNGAEIPFTLDGSDEMRTIRGILNKDQKSRVPWAPMSIREYDMAPMRYKGSNLGRARPQAGFSGPMMYAWRVPPAYDARICRTAKRGMGGTVLVDVSGSMRLTARDIQHIVEKRPEATVAAYSSRIGLRTTGCLIIVARRGRVIRSIQRVFYGAGNGVDGPALAWLGTQQGPRTWICDGEVTGVGDRSSNALSSSAREIQRIIDARRYSCLDTYFRSQDRTLMGATR